MVLENPSWQGGEEDSSNPSIKSSLLLLPLDSPLLSSAQAPVVKKLKKEKNKGKIG